MELTIGPRGNPVITTAERRRALGTDRYLFPVDTRLAWMDGIGLDVQVLSLAPPLMGYDLPGPDAVALSREVNDELAEVAAAHPDRFRALATLPMSDVDAALAELERAMGLAGVVGVQLGTNVMGVSWDAAHLQPVLATAEALDALVLLHPVDVRAGASLSRYHLNNLIGNPLETTEAAAALVFGGVLDRLPALRVCLCHGGGYLALAAGRFDRGWSVRSEARRHTGAPPRDYIRRFLVDDLLHSPAALRYVVDVLGADRVVLGTDHPADMGSEDPVGEVERNTLLTAQERAAVLGGNLERELRLTAG